MGRRIIYLCGLRGFSTRALIRKLAGVPDAFRARGHDVLHLCGGDVGQSSAGQDVARLAPPGVRKPKWYHRWNLTAPLVNSVSERRDVRHDERLLPYILEQAAAFRPHLLWERYARLMSAGLTAARRLGIPYVVEWLDNLVPYRWSWYHRRAVETERRTYEQADFVVVVSAYQRDLMAREGIARDKILVAYNAVDPEEFRRDEAAREEVRRELGVADDEFLVGFLGSYAPYHDAVRLVQAAEILAGRRSGVRVWMVGDGPDYERCRDEAQRAGLLESRAVMLGPPVPARDVPRVLSALDVAVLPGSTEMICPIKVQEYMAAGLPTVLPDYPANREVIRQDETGAFFRPKDASDLARAIADLAAGRERCRAMGDAARRDVMEHYTWDKTWGAALTEILDRTGLGQD